MVQGPVFLTFLKFYIIRRGGKERHVEISALDLLPTACYVKIIK
jgi:hypothetical protein